MADQVHQVAKSPSFEGHLSTTPPQWLAHYTTQRGLIGIVKNAELWATKVQYMNDSTEFDLALALAEKRVQATKDMTTDDEIRRKLSRLFPRKDRIANVNLFAACFCESADLLSQWRGYSGSNYGFSLVMNSEAIALRAKGAGFELGKCIYDLAEMTKVIDELIFNSLDIGTDDDNAAAFERGLLRVGAFFKDSNFVEENEWRIVSRVISVREPRVDFREGNSMLLPYFHLKIGEARESPIKRAFVGPCPHPKLTQSSVALLLAQQGIRDELSSIVPGVADVMISSVPYRNW